MAAACDRGDQEVEVDLAPPVHVVEVRATTGTLESTTSDGTVVQLPAKTAIAADGSTDGVLPTSSITVKFDRFLEPNSVLRQSFCLQSSTADVADPNGCVEGRVFLEPSYDPVLREVHLRIGKSDPASSAPDTLAAETVYTLTILAPPAEETSFDYGIRAFDGAPLAGKVVFRFKTGMPAADPPPEVEPDTDRFCLSAECLDPNGRSSPAVDACRAGCGTDAACLENCCRKNVACLDGRDPTPSVLACKSACDPNDQACLDACCHRSIRTILGACSYGGCHMGAGQTADMAAMGLRMDSPQAIALTAVGKVAKQTMTGENADQADQSPERFGRAMPIIDPKNPGNSYLVYKMLAHLGYEQSAGSPGPEEYLRMRERLVVGMPMPANINSRNMDNRPPDQALRDLEAIRAWIAQGAPTECR